MANYNKVILCGHLTRDPEMRTTQGGVAVTKFGMAVNRKFKDQETTCFVDCVAFGKQAELINQYLAKGKPLFVDGRLNFSTWEAQDGGRRSKLEVIVEQFQFIGPREAQPAPAGGGGGYQASGGGFGDQGEGDVPF